MRTITLILALLAASCTPGRVQNAQQSRTRLHGIAVETLEGQRAQLHELQAKRPMLIALWATWCDSCAEEFEALRRLAPKAEAQGAYVVAVSEGEARTTVADFVRARALAYPHLVDEAFAVADAIGARSIPTTLVLDADGYVAYRGAALNEDALRALDQVIASRKRQGPGASSAGQP